MIEPKFSSNTIQLNSRHWLIVLVIVTALFTLTPIAFQQIEPFQPAANYRIPYSLSNDYWHFHRYCKMVCDTDKTLIIGDSVMWGPFVAPDQTLAGFLNEIAGADQFANLAVDGLHPLALTGLIEHYGSAITDKDIILHLNLLWLNSPRADLQDEEESSFNHPRLVPQFSPIHDLHLHFDIT
ncbi:MAG: hypothetical protein GY869_09745, partial [Planctomycetes bacterium]|nr:hypothetical protein [Planctomycetota bacterium]